eukprot:TRINITY_DN8592_c0_g1_i1.p1 TRINITY_DN8592_c0_g1~~TRINITY_DN8592_c0_g1_i1.p1  ORF type:complete len:299 (+),score=105.05 TRINITY_DN8592_c0_g1_i1:3-899(+)
MALAAAVATDATALGTPPCSPPRVLPHLSPPAEHLPPPAEPSPIQSQLLQPTALTRRPSLNALPSAPLPVPAASSTQQLHPQHFDLNLVNLSARAAAAAAPLPTPAGRSFQTSFQSQIGSRTRFEHRPSPLDFDQQPPAPDFDFVVEPEEKQQQYSRVLKDEADEPVFRESRFLPRHLRDGNAAPSGFSRDDLPEPPSPPPSILPVVDAKLLSMRNLLVPIESPMARVANEEVFLSRSGRLSRKKSVRGEVSLQQDGTAARPHRQRRASEPKEANDVPMISPERLRRHGGGHQAGPLC